MPRALLCAVLLCVGCGADEFPDYSKLESLKVLALIADVPEAAPGETVTITPLITDMAGGGRSLSYTAKACVDPGVSAGASPTCPDNGFTQTLASAVTISDPLFIAPNYTGYLTSSTVSVVIPADTLVFAGKSSVDRQNGVSYLVTYDLTANDGTKVRAFKRILVSYRTTRNANPVFVNITTQGSDFEGKPLTLNYDMETRINENSQEQYTVLNEDGTQTTTKTETLTTTWFVSEGELDKTRTTGPVGENKFHRPPTYSEDQSFILIAVTRDGRGGTGYFMRWY